MGTTDEIDGTAGVSQNGDFWGHAYMQADFRQKTQNCNLILKIFSKIWAGCTIPVRSIILIGQMRYGTACPPLRGAPTPATATAGGINGSEAVRMLKMRWPGYRTIRSPIWWTRWETFGISPPTELPHNLSITPSLPTGELGINATIGSGMGYGSFVYDPNDCVATCRARSTTREKSTFEIMIVRFGKSFQRKHLS